MTTGDLFNSKFEQYLATRHRKTDPDTSREAAASVAPKLTRVQKEVLAFAASCGFGGFTDTDIEAQFASTRSTYRTRRAELRAMGYLEDTGQRRKVDGSNRVIWRITDRGLALHKEWSKP
jgi:hypothetical protein